MILTVKDRLFLLDLLPEQADLTTLRVVREAQSALSFSEAELATLKFTRQDNGGISWQTAGDTSPDIPLGTAVVEVFKAQIDALSAKAKATVQHLEMSERLSELSV